MRTNYSQAGFRFFDDRFAVFDKRIIADHKEDFWKYDEADSVLTYGYIDHEKGFIFQVLSLSKNNNGEIGIIENQPEESLLLTAETLSDEEALIISDDEKYRRAFHKQLRENAAGHAADKKLNETRQMSIIDELRDPFHIDDLEVYIFKNKSEPEICFVRIEGCDDRHLYGRLLSEPDQELGVHLDEKISFTLKRMNDDTWMAICDLDQNRK